MTTKRKSNVEPELNLELLTVSQLKQSHPTILDDRLFKLMKKANPSTDDITILNAIYKTKKKYDPSMITPEMKKMLDEWDAF